MTAEKSQHRPPTGWIHWGAEIMVASKSNDFVSRKTDPTSLNSNQKSETPGRCYEYRYLGGQRT